MTDNTRAVHLLDAMLNRIIGASWVCADGEWIGWALVVKLALKRRLEAVPPERFEEEAGRILLEWLSTTELPAAAASQGARRA